MPETTQTSDIVKSEQSSSVVETEDDFSNTIILLEYCYGVVCSFCGTKVLDPDKSKNQINLKDRCPSCNKDPDEEKQRIARERKHQNKQNNRKANRERNNNRRKK